MNLARLDLVSIRLIVFCEEGGSLSIAAKRANMSLSRASHRLATFEESVGQQLFERHHFGLVPTAAGVLVAAYGREMLSVAKFLADQLAVRCVNTTHLKT
jgi:DNA-binding transcriptional LysR family regulator